MITRANEMSVRGVWPLASLGLDWSLRSSHTLCMLRCSLPARLAAISFRYALSALVFSLLVGGAFAAHGEDFARDPAWTKLLHFRPSLRGFRGEADGPKFYLSPIGKEDAAAELQATLAGLRAPAAGDESIRCRFPGRYLLLRKHFPDLPVVPDSACPRFNEFRRVLSARSATLIFSSYYLNNPSSAFGHVFLRLNKSEASQPGERYELLDHGINYAANLTTNNALAYGAAGVLGFFHGSFTNVPYFYKVREYNDFEARDIFEYDLNLSVEEVELLVAHLWELGQTWFDYYYFDENCAYHILGALEAVTPQRRLMERLSFYVIPSEGLRAATDEPGFVRPPRLRPSGRRVFRERLARLPESEQILLSQYVRNRDASLIPASDPVKTAAFLDTAMDWVDYRYAKDLLPKEAGQGPNSEVLGWKQDLLVRRAGLGLKTPTLEVQAGPDESPHLSHGSGKLAIESGHSNAVGGYARLKARFAHHDLLDPLPGMPAGAEIEMGILRLIYESGPRHVRVEGLDLYNILSLNPVDRFEKKFSWESSLGFSQIRDRDCATCRAGRLMVGGGWAAQLGRRLTVFGMGRVEGEFSPDFAKYGLRVGVGPELGLLWRSGQWGVLARPAWLYRLWSANPNYWRVNSELRFNFGRVWAAFVRGDFESGQQQGGLGVSASF